MRKNRGFTLIEVLVVVAIVGILTLIGIWNYYNSIQRARQKRTMADMRAVGEAWEARAIDTHAYNAAGFTMPATTLNFDTVKGMLTPTYIRIMPSVDGWGAAFEFDTDQPVGGPAAQTYAIRSAGRDGIFQTGSYAQGAITDFDCDIVYSNGSFVTWPEGNQGH